MNDRPAYSVLAAGYDVVMEHVDYEAWAEYVHELLQEWAPDAVTLLEFGCGTGSFALALRQIATYRYAGTDAVAQMIRVAKAKAELEAAHELQFSVADFSDYRVDRPVDAVVLLYDGLNYLLEKARVRALLTCTFAALKPGGLFIFDQSTPTNSINNAAYFEDAGSEQGFSYTRRSVYDPVTEQHTTTFDIEIEGHVFHEQHVQQAYDIETILELVGAVGFEVLGAFDGFTREPAGPHTERVHWVVRKP